MAYLMPECLQEFSHPLQRDREWEWLAALHFISNVKSNCRGVWSEPGSNPFWWIFLLLPVPSWGYTAFKGIERYTGSHSEELLSVCSGKCMWERSWQLPQLHFKIQQTQEQTENIGWNTGSAHFCSVTLHPERTHEYTCLYSTCYCTVHVK